MNIYNNRLNIVNWFRYPLFQNLADIDQKKGLVRPIIWDEKKLLSKCLENCNILQSKDCIRYCHNLNKHMQESLDYASKKCINGGKECCKRYSRDNDFAYMYCLQKKTVSSGWRQASIVILCVFIFEMIIFLICYINVFY